MLRLLICLIALTWFEASVFLPATAQTLGDYAPDVRCFSGAAPATQKEAECLLALDVRARIESEARVAAELWTVLLGEKQKLGHVRIGKVDPLFVVVADDELAPSAARAARRAEGGAFYDPASGAIVIRRESLRQDLLQGTVGTALSRAVGMAILAIHPPTRDAMRHEATSPVLLSAFEGLAGTMDIPARQKLSSIEVGRDFSLPLFGAHDPETSWGTGVFWAEVIRKTKDLTGTDTKSIARDIFSAIAASSEGDGGVPEIVGFVSSVFGPLGWQRFSEDGFAYAYAETMAAQRWSDRPFRTLIEEIAFRPGEKTLVVTGELPAGYATDFYTLSVPADLLRESRIQVKLCAIDPAGQACNDDERLHLLVDKDTASRRDGLNYIETRVGYISRPQRNQVEIDLLSALGGNEADGFEHQIALGVSATFGEGRALKYRLIVSGAALDPPCQWSSMAATLNPWWAGNLGAPDALVPNTKDVPAQLRADLADSLKDQWYLSEEAYRAEIDWDKSVFQGAKGKARLNAIKAFLSKEQLAYAHMLTQVTEAKPYDLAFSVLMPTKAKAAISGAFSDVGDVCVSPLSVSASPGFGTLADMAGGDPGAILAEMGLPPELAQAGSDIEALAILMGTQGRLEELETDRDVILQIASPNLWTQQRGFLPPGGAKPLSHQGATGWRPNAGFNLYIRLPGTSPSELKPGRYRAEATMQFAKDVQGTAFEPERALPFYVRGWGRADETEYEDYVENGLSGWLTIERQTYGAAVARLELSGATWRLASPAPALSAVEAESAGQVKVTIGRFLILGLSKDQPLPVLNPLNLVSEYVLDPMAEPLQ